MIDIHCHILYGIDDGAKDMQESVDMARIAYNDGIRQIIATPHFTHDYINNKQIVMAKVEELQKQLDHEQVDIKIHPGNEVRLESADFVYEHARNDNFCYLGEDSKFILLEQPWKGYCSDTIEVAKWFLQLGKTPIIPHPERHNFIRENPLLIKQLIDIGCWTQVSVDSLLGKNSDESKDFATWMIEHDYVSTLATDAHNTHRKPNLSEGFQFVEAISGLERSEEIRSRIEQIIE